MANRARVATLLVALLALVALGAAQQRLDAIALDNLSNRTFVRAHQWTPDDFGIPYDDVQVPSDSLALAGWWMPAPPGPHAATTVILVHGYSSNMSKVMRMWAPNLHAAGYSLLAIDLRNHGLSPDAGGRVTYGVDEARDVLAAMAWVQAHAGGLGVDPGRIVLYGGSMGAASVLDAAGQAPPGLLAVIADSSFASFGFEAHVDGKDKGYPRAVVDWVVARMDDLAPAPPTHSRPDQALARLRVPVLLAQCADDVNITPPNFERLKAVAPPSTETWSAPCPRGLSAEHHLDGWMDPGYNATVLGFLAAA